MNEEFDQLETPAPASVPTGPVSQPLTLSRLFLFILVGIFLIFAGMGWRNWRLKRQLQTSKATFATLLVQPTPSYTATRSANLKQATIQVPETETQLPVTTKGGLVLAVTASPTPTQTPTPTPTPIKVKVVTAAVPAPTEISSWLTKVYLDSQFSYQIRFNEAWIFRRTHGTNAAASPQILSRIDLSKNRRDNPDAYVSAEVLGGYGLTNLEDWLKKYEPSLDWSQGEKLTYRGQPAIKFNLNAPNPTEKLYFLQGAYAYRLTVWEKGSLSAETRAIRDSFRVN